MKHRTVLALLQTLLTAAALVSARDANASTTHSHAAHDVLSTSANWTVPSLKNHTQLFGGKHNDSIPSLGGYRRNVALLLQAREEESDQLQGCIAVRITPQHFLTRSSCVWDKQHPPTLFIEESFSPGQSQRHPLVIKKTTAHPDYGVNLAIVEVDEQSTSRYSRIVQAVPLLDFSPSYYRPLADLGFVSIDNIFNPSLAKNPQGINGLIRVPVSSCKFNSNDAAVNCYAPMDLASREIPFEFGQGMMVWNNIALVGLPDCPGLCSGGMFYSTTHLAKFKTWINQVTGNRARWLTLIKQRVQPVAPEQEPSFVSFSTGTGTEISCGGSLIAPRYILTTASCVAQHQISSARVNHGARKSHRSDEDDTIPVKSVHIHPQFANRTDFSNDVAIVQLSAPTIFPPTLLASDDSLTSDLYTGTCKPRLAAVDASVMCVPDQESCDADAGTTKPGSSIEQWNLGQGDGVFDVPEAATYYLLGVSLGLTSAEAVTKKPGDNSTSISALCSSNETVGDDDTAASPVVRLATPETMEFIDSISVDHTWRNPHQLPMGIIKNMLKRVEKASSNGSVVSSFSVSYDGPLVFEEPPKNLDLGFVVGLRFEKYGQNYCGGSLIASSYVLTAAHCVGSDREIFVSVGSHESAGSETELIAVKKTHVMTHPLYGKRSMYSYDVAILELESQAYPKPIILDNSRELNPSTYFTLLGYGANSASSTELSTVLRSVDLPYFPRDKCKSMFPELDESMFCAGGELARDACTGDSGSPLVRIVKDKPLLVGVVSSGRNGCGTPGVPGVYAFVAEMEAFIDSVVAGDNWSKAVSVPPTPRSVSSDSNSTANGDSRSSATASNATVLRSSAVNMSDLPFEIINMASGTIEHQLSIIELAQDTPDLLQAAVMKFLVGDYQKIAGWAPSINQEWKLAFYSTGDLTGIMQVIAQHKDKPLYTRKSRFSRPVSTSGSEEPVNLSQTSCVNGHIRH